MVRVNDKYFINIMDKNYIVETIVKNKKSGKDNYVNLGYFGNLESLFDFLLKQFILDKVPKDKNIELKELKDIIVSSRKEIVEILSDLTGTI